MRSNSYVSHIDWLTNSSDAPLWLMMCMASWGLKSASIGTMVAPYVMVAMKHMTHVHEFLPRRATLSPGFMPIC